LLDDALVNQSRYRRLADGLQPDAQRAHLASESGPETRARHQHVGQVVADKKLASPPIPHTSI